MGAYNLYFRGFDGKVTKVCDVKARDRKELMRKVAKMQLDHGKYYRCEERKNNGK